MISARQAFLERLIDDAGLFPPAALPLDDALAADHRARTGSHAWMLGRFIVAAARIDALAAALPPGEGPLDLSVIVAPARAAAEIEAALGWQRIAPGALHVGAIETRLGPVEDGDLAGAVLRLMADIDATALPRDTPVYVEFGFGDGWESHVATTVDALADARTRSPHDVCGKLRCGGVVAEAVPSPEQLALAIGTLRARGVPFKATAGLHHPVRHRDGAAGFVVHGFLNVIGAAVLDRSLDLDDRTRREMLADTDPSHFTLDDDAFSWRDLRAGGRAIVEARNGFVRSYGSCSFTEPVDDLIELGVLEGVAAG